MSAQYIHRVQQWTKEKKGQRNLPSRKWDSFWCGLVLGKKDRGDKLFSIKSMCMHVGGHIIMAILWMDENNGCVYTYVWYGVWYMCIFR